jgi:hypothetical protein
MSLILYTYHHPNIISTAWPTRPLLGGGCVAGLADIDEKVGAIPLRFCKALPLFVGTLPTLDCLNAEVEGASLIGVPTDGVFEDEWPLDLIGKGSSTAIDSTRRDCE